jgi:hypothetical protein
LLTVSSGLSEAYQRVLAADWQNIAELSEHADVCIVDHQLNHDRDLAWSKVVAIRALLEVGKQNIVWMDADAFAFNPKSFAKLETEFLPASKSILFTNDYDELYDEEASEGSSINCGVFITRNTPWSTHFWESVWTDFPQSLHDQWWEQRAVLMYREANQTDFAENTHIIPYRIMNTYQKLHKTSDFIVHSSGGGGMDKYPKILRQYCWYTNESALVTSCNYARDNDWGWAYTKSHQ